MFSEILEQSEINKNKAKEEQKRFAQVENEFVKISREFVDKYYCEIKELDGKKVIIPYVGSIFDSWDSIPPDNSRTRVKISRRDDASFGSDMRIEFKGWFFTHAHIRLGLDSLKYKYMGIRNPYNFSCYGFHIFPNDETFSSGESLMTALKGYLAKLKWIT